MAHLINTARRQVSSALCSASNNGSAYYKQLLESNKQYIVDGGNPEKVKELSKQLYYTTLASFPKRYQHAQQEMQIVKQKWANRAELQLEEIGIATLFLAEVYAWFSASVEQLTAAWMDPEFL
ncbi:unnamed protein product [Closterium sp. NIES-53]